MGPEVGRTFASTSRSAMVLGPPAGGGGGRKRKWQMAAAGGPPSDKDTVV